MDIHQLHPLESDFLAQSKGNTSQLLDFSNSNEFKLFIFHYGTFPNIIRCHGTNVVSLKDMLIEKYTDQVVDVTYSMNTQSQSQPLKFLVSTESSDRIVTFFFKGNIVMSLNEDDKSVKLLFRNADMELLDRLRALIGQHVDESHKECHINLIVKDDRGLSTKKVQISPTVLELSKYYNNGFEKVDRVIKERLNKADDKGLVLLHGVPGTGKTTYIRYLIGELDKEVLFLPPQVAAQMTSPDMLDFFVSNPNTILVIEDAEELIIDRGQQQGSAVSALLNLTDGLLSDCLNIQVICSFNTDIARVDSALMRKGRLIASYEFKPLEVEMANALTKELKTDVVYTVPKTLAEIFNYEEEDYQVPKKRVVGFR